MLDNKFQIKARIRENITIFNDILPGRCFVLATVDNFGKAFMPERPTKIFIKLNKNRAQKLDDDNIRTNLPSSQPVFEVILIVDPVKVTDEQV